METGDVFWTTGNFENWEEDNQNTDEWALANGYAAVVPVRIDMTAHDLIPGLKMEFKRMNYFLIAGEHRATFTHPT